MLSILVAYTKSSRVIGSDGRIPWNLPSERVRFKRICAGRRVIMGRRTFEEIGHALSYCTIVIVSRSMAEAAGRKGCAHVPEGCLLAASFEEAVRIAGAPVAEPAGPEPGRRAETTAVTGSTEILVAGGEEIYRQALPYTSRIYATEILADFPGDRVFPALPASTKVCGNCPPSLLDSKCTWSKKTESRHQDADSGIWYEYVTYERITSRL